VLVSILAFVLNGIVSTDRVQTILSVQGYEDTRPGYEEAYERTYIENNLHLPLFYCSLSNSGTAWLFELSADRRERGLAQQWASQRYGRRGILAVLETLKTIDQRAKTYLLGASGPQDLHDRLSSPIVASLTTSEVGRIAGVAQEASSDVVQWHYPILRWNGIDKAFLGTRPNSRIDHWISSVLLGLFSIPKFWMATMLIVFFTTAEYGGWTNIFPSVGIWSGRSGDSVLSMIWQSKTQLILPVLVVIIPDIAYLVRLVRGTIVEEYNKEYIKTARSKGAPDGQILRSHLIPNSLIPTITIISSVIPSIFSSAVIIEVIFNMPGIGRLLLDSIRSADWAVVFPILLVVSVVTMVSYLVADVLMAWANPKIKLLVALLDPVIQSLLGDGANNLDLASGLKPPLSESKDGVGFLLGTDQLGRDVTSGIVRGARVSFIIAFFSVALSVLVGLVMGCLSGFYGDQGVRKNVLQVATWIVTFVLTIYYVTDIFGYGVSMYNIIPLMCALIVGYVADVLLGLLAMKKFGLPFDLVIQRISEVQESIPGLFLILALVSVVAQPTFFTIALVIAVLFWNQIARNILPSLVVIIAFQFSSAILLESSLSFLGVGTMVEDISWGKILNEARQFPNAWWLAVFPGLAIFLVLYALNILGDYFAHSFHGWAIFIR